MGGGAVTGKIRPAGSSVYQTDEKAAGCRSEGHCDHTAPAARLSFIVTVCEALCSGEQNRCGTHYKIA